MPIPAVTPPAIPVPTPFPVPTPDPGAAMVSDPLWDVDNWSQGISAFQTFFVFLEQYYILSIIFFSASLIIIVMVILGFVGSRAKSI